MTNSSVANRVAIAALFLFAFNAVATEKRATRSSSQSFQVTSVASTKDQSLSRTRFNNCNGPIKFAPTDGSDGDGYFGEGFKKQGCDEGGLGDIAASDVRNTYFAKAEIKTADLAGMDQLEKDMLFHYVRQHSYSIKVVAERFPQLDVTKLVKLRQLSPSLPVRDMK